MTGRSCDTILAWLNTTSRSNDFGRTSPAKQPLAAHHHHHGRARDARHRRPRHQRGLAAESVTNMISGLAALHHLGDPHV